MGNMDILTKYVHFLPIRANYPVEKLAQLYIQEIVRLHEVLSTIVSNRDPRFTSRFWGTLQKAFRMKLYLSTTYHPQMDGQIERTIQTLEEMLRAYILDKLGGSARYLPLIEFVYNNSYHASIGMAPYESLYSRKCQSPLYQYEPMEQNLLGHDLVRQTMEDVKRIRECILTAQSRQKSYADQWSKPLEF